MFETSLFIIIRLSFGVNTHIYIEVEDTRETRNIVKGLGIDGLHYAYNQRPSKDSCMLYIGHDVDLVAHEEAKSHLQAKHIKPYNSI
jgi:hypothetical protein